MSFSCKNCGNADTQYAVFSGGREYYCPTCDDNFAYPPIAEIPADQRPRAMLLQTPDGVVALRAQMDQELARLRPTIHNVSPYTHDLPETSSDDRMHILAADCWCHPTLSAERITHHDGRGGGGPS